jgi:hypothetical protein
LYSSVDSSRFSRRPTVSREVVATIGQACREACYRWATEW